eukprot:14955149-Alexandrium_andersonii.AAC.1
MAAGTLAAPPRQASWRSEPRRAVALFTPRCRTGTPAFGLCTPLSGLVFGERLAMHCTVGAAGLVVMRLTCRSSISCCKACTIVLAGSAGRAGRVEGCTSASWGGMGCWSGAWRGACG